MQGRGTMLGIALAVAPSLAFGALFGDRLAGERPDDVGNGTLAPCAPTPNCVSSRAADAEHAIAPLAFTGNADAALERLTGIAQTMAGAKLVSRRPGYVHLEYASAVVGFVDDVEFLANPAERVIEVRSAARVGRGDFGVNRRRVEALRRAFQ